VNQPAIARTTDPTCETALAIDPEDAAEEESMYAARTAR
jgi:hypothetical protein